MASGQPFGGHRRGGSEKVCIGTLVVGVEGHWMGYMVVVSTSTGGCIGCTDAAARVLGCAAVCGPPTSHVQYLEGRRRSCTQVRSRDVISRSILSGHPVLRLQPVYVALPGWRAKRTET